MSDWIDLDSFAGGGGASTGLRSALEKPVDIAINHSDAAIAMHTANHPETRHYCESIWDVNPREACRGRKVRVAWFSPDCTHFSRAKGGKPRDKNVRGLAGVVIEWAREVRPRVIILENVREFQDWGPLDEKGHPIAARKGEDFRAWLAELGRYYPTIEHRMIRADRHGAPTSRDRFYLVARLDGQCVRWPEATHGEGASRPVRTAAEIIDWSLPCPSIFGRKKPLAEATLRRIAAGLRRYVIESADPFIVPVTHTSSGNRTHGVDTPLRTITTARGGELALVTPYINTQFGMSIGRSIEAPLPTITGGGMGHQAIVAPTLITTGYGERKGQAPRALDLHKPVGTVVSGGKHALVSAFLAKHYGGVYAQDIDAPLSTVTCREHLTAQHVALEPVEASFVEKFYSSARAGADVREPLPTVTATGTHLAEVRAFLIAYYKSERDGQRLTAPLRTVPTHDRFGLVTVHGVDYQIVDIGLRMLSPRELYNAQGFPHDYVIDVTRDDGHRLTKAEQIELCGNSVCPDVARAIVAANTHERWEAVA